jgi:hydroxyethylthiazole kinase
MELDEAIVRIRKKKPLIHHMTNLVVTNLTANFTLAVGALPIMAYEKEEMVDISNVADVLVLNLGTPTADLVESMLLAGRNAKEKGKKIILDPVGAGASEFRDRAVKSIMREVKPGVIRGNFAEICSIYGKKAKIKGVESPARALSTAMGIAEKCAMKEECVVAITGFKDVVSDGKRTAIISGGSKMLKEITGSGCIATTAIACFYAVENSFDAAVHGLELIKICSENLEWKGPSSFQQAFFDRVFGFRGLENEKKERVEVR